MTDATPLHLGSWNEVIINGVNGHEAPGFADQLQLEHPGIGRLLGPHGRVAVMNQIVCWVNPPGYTSRDRSDNYVPWGRWQEIAWEYFSTVSEVMGEIVEHGMADHRLAPDRSGPAITGVRHNENGATPNHFVMPSLAAIVSLASPVARAAALEQPDAEDFFTSLLAFEARYPDGILKAPEPGRDKELLAAKRQAQNRQRRTNARRPQKAYVRPRNRDWYEAWYEHEAWDEGDVIALGR